MWGREVRAATAMAVLVWLMPVPVSLVAIVIDRLVRGEGKLLPLGALTLGEWPWIVASVTAALVWASGRRRFTWPVLAAAMTAVYLAVGLPGHHAVVGDTGDIPGELQVLVFLGPPFAPVAAVLVWRALSWAHGCAGGAAHRPTRMA